MASKKGRPKNNNNNIIINDINVEYLSTKTDKFDNSVVYLKLTDPKNKLKPIIDTQANDKDIKLSCIWTTDTQDVILKVKEKWLNVADDLQTLTNYVINADFTAYSLDTDNGNVRGYYIKIPKIKKKKIEDVNDDN
jgi:hypothetical protein